MNTNTITIVGLVLVTLICKSFSEEGVTRKGEEIIGPAYTVPGFVYKDAEWTEWKTCEEDTWVNTYDGDIDNPDAKKRSMFTKHIAVGCGPIPTPRPVPKTQEDPIGTVVDGVVSYETGLQMHFFLCSRHFPNGPKDGLLRGLSFRSQKGNDGKWGATSVNYLCANSIPEWIGLNNNNKSEGAWGALICKKENHAICGIQNQAGTIDGQNVVTNIRLKCCPVPDKDLPDALPKDMRETVENISDFADFLLRDIEKFSFYNASPNGSDIKYIKYQTNKTIAEYPENPEPVYEPKGINGRSFCRKIKNGYGPYLWSGSHFSTFSLSDVSTEFLNYGRIFRIYLSCADKTATALSYKTYQSTRPGEIVAYQVRSADSQVFPSDGAALECNDKTGIKSMTLTYHVLKKDPYKVNGITFGITCNKDEKYLSKTDKVKSEDELIDYGITSGCPQGKMICGFRQWHLSKENYGNIFGDICMTVVFLKLVPCVK